MLVKRIVCMLAFTPLAAPHAGLYAHVAVAALVHIGDAIAAQVELARCSNAC